MAKGSPMLAFAAGFGGGYLDEKNAARRRTIEDEELQARREDRAAQQEERARVKNDRLALANAARPATVEAGAGGALRPESMDNRDVGLAENASLPNGGLSEAPYRAAGKTFTDGAQAQAAADTYNAPEARRGRQAAALDAAGRPTEALSLENAAATQKRTAFTFTKEQEERARQLKDEGALDAAKALRTGDAAGMAEAFNRNGKFKIDGVPEITPETREVPGIGTVKSYNAKVRIIGPDGQVQEKVFNSHDLSTQLMPYDKLLEMQRKGSDSDSKHQNRLDQLDLAGKKLELQGELGAAKLEAARARNAGNGGAATKEERLRYTSLFSEAGRRMGEAQKALGALQKDILFMSQAAKPGSPQAQELADLRASLGSYKEERDLYSGLLAGSQTKVPALADAKPTAGKPAAAAGPAKPASKAEYEKLPKGTTYVHPDGTTRVKG